MAIYVLLLDTISKLYNYFPNNDDSYWSEQVNIINDSRYACHYFKDEESLLASKIIPEGYKEDPTLFSTILNLSHKNK